MMEKNYLFYANLSSEKIFQELETSSSGLTQDEVEKRLSLYGPNELAQTTTTWLDILKNQIMNPFIPLFIIIAIIYFFTQQYTESIILLVIMIINTCIGFYQEYHSNKAMALLQSYLQVMALVQRAHQSASVPLSTLVPGDVILLKAGDIVPADCRLIESQNLMVNEAPLTGESMPSKKTHTKQDAEITALHNAYTCCFAGTVVVDGSGIGVVFATGQHSMFGSIAQLVTHSISKSNVSKGTMELARIIVALVIISLVVIVFINVMVKTEPVSLTNWLFFAAALAITAIPSALPIVITFCLTQGAMVLHKHKMIVKRLSAIEDLGSIEVFCTDKTGTLTENVLSVEDVYTTDEHDILVYAALTSATSGHTVSSRSFDAAIMQKLTPAQRADFARYTVIKELPFTYERHRNITLAQKDGIYIIITKGSAEYVTHYCSLSQPEMENLTAWVQKHELAMNRVIAVAIKEVPDLAHAQASFNDESMHYDSLGLLSFVDPLKTTASMAIKKAQELGVQIKVLSGDSRDICFTIAQQLRLENTMDNVVLGSDFEKSTEQEKIFLAQNRTIFARVTPEQKYQIIIYLQRTYSVGYMGDGINDAPGLKIANIGIAVTDAAPVAREAAEIILLQKSLLNVILGIEEGRKTIINTLKYIKITISSNVGNFYSLAFSSLLINYLPMLPLQLLFLDLVADFPLIAISTDAVTYQELKKPLHYSTKDIALVTFLFGLISSPFDFMIFAFFKSDAATLQTSWFMTSALKQFVLIFSLRTTLPFWRAHRPSLLLCGLCVAMATVVIGLPFTAFGQKFFLFKCPTMHDLFIIFAVVIAYFITTESVKLLYYRTNSGK
jgi:Mg2+-importing ATPase